MLAECRDNVDINILFEYPWSQAALSLMQWARSAHLAPHGVVRVLLGCMRVRSQVESAENDRSH